MKVRLIGSLAAFLTGTGLAMAQAPTASVYSATTEVAAPDAGKKLATPVLPPTELPVTPYWPNPLGPQQCAPSAGMLPGAPSKTHPGDGTEGFWASAEYLVWWAKRGPLAAPHEIFSARPEQIGRAHV